MGFGPRASPESSHRFRIVIVRKVPLPQPFPASPEHHSEGCAASLQSRKAGCFRRRLVFFLLGLLASGLVACETAEDTVFTTLSVAFRESSSSVQEIEESLTVEVVLSDPSAEPVSVEFAVTSSEAMGHDGCSSRDFAGENGTLTFAPGQTELSIELQHLDDDVPEIDELIEISLVAASGARLGELRAHQLRIDDDDRSALLDVRRDFGAVGDGESDDTDAIQAAIDRTESISNAVVFFPEGSYRVTALSLRPSANYVGRDATLVLAPGQSTDAKMLTLSYDGAEASRRVLVQGLTFNGARDEQGPFDEWEYQDSVLLFALGEPAASGRLRLEAQDLSFENSGGNGLMLGTNTEARICDLAAEEVFTDFLKLRGGNTEVTLVGATGQGTVGTTGIAISSTDLGYQDSLTIQAILRDVHLATGDLDLDLADNSSVDIERLHMDQPPLYIRAKNSVLRVSESRLAVGPPLYRFNRIVAPSDVSFEDVEFLLSETIDPSVSVDEDDRTWAALGVTWDDITYAFSSEQEDQFVEAMTGQSLTATNCSFMTADDVEEGDSVYVALTESGDDGSHTLLLEEPEVAETFDATFAPSCSGCSRGP